MNSNKEHEIILNRIFIETILNNLFDIECPPEKDNKILTTGDEILKVYKKWYDFWNKRRPNLSNPDISVYNNNTITTAMICDAKIAALMEQLRDIGLDKEFIKRYCHKYI